MKDWLRFNSLTFRGYHGVSPAERERGQNFEVDVEVSYDQQQAADCDDLAMAVDARDVYRLVRDAVEGGPCSLVEKLAQRIADSLLELNRVERVVVRVRKPEVRFTGDENEGYEVEITRP